MKDKINGQYQIRINLFNYEFIITIINWARVRNWAKKENPKLLKRIIAYG